MTMKVIWTSKYINIEICEFFTKSFVWSILLYVSKNWISEKAALKQQKYDENKLDWKEKI